MSASSGPGILRRRFEVASTAFEIRCHTLAQALHRPKSQPHRPQRFRSASRAAARHPSQQYDSPYGVVRGASTIDELTYRELRELAYMGATVLHDEAIFPVREAGIPVHIKNTNAPEDAGTRITRGGLDQPPTGRVTGIAGRKDFTIIALEKTLMNAEIGFGRRLLGVLERHGLSWEHLPSGIDTLSIVLKSDVVGDRLETLVEEIQRDCQPDSIEVNTDIALIATVGRGMSHVPGTAARLFGALAEAGIEREGAGKEAAAALGALEEAEDRSGFFLLDPTVTTSTEESEL